MITADIDNFYLVTRIGCDSLLKSVTYIYIRRSKYLPKELFNMVQITFINSCSFTWKDSRGKYHYSINKNYVNWSNFQKLDDNAKNLSRYMS